MNNVPTLETARLLLRPLSPFDLKDFNEYASVPGVGEPAGWLSHKSVAESASVLAMMIDNPNENIFGLETKDQHKMIGTIGIKAPKIDAGKYQTLPGPELGYVLAKSYWGQGLMPEALTKVLEYIFGETPAAAVYLDIFTDNDRSAGVAHKLGFQFQGHSQEKQSFRAGEFFVNYYMLTKDDWQRRCK